VGRCITGHWIDFVRALVLLGCLSGTVFSAQAQTARSDTLAPRYPQYPSETPARFEPVSESFDYTRLDTMILMRDSVKLHTVIIIPKGAKAAPILLTRTPYNASRYTSIAQSSSIGSILGGGDNVTEIIIESGYIRVIQDVRGKYGSEGDYVMTGRCTDRRTPPR